MKFQHHATSHGNALTRPHAAPPEGQIRQGSFDDDALAWIVDGTNLCRVLDGNTFIIAARIGHELAEERGEAMGAELIDAAKKCEEMTTQVHGAFSYMQDTAKAFREEAKKIFQRIEDCSMLTEEVRKTCEALRQRIERKEPAHQEHQN